MSISSPQHLDFMHQNEMLSFPSEKINSSLSAEESHKYLIQDMTFEDIHCKLQAEMSRPAFGGLNIGEGQNIFSLQ